MNVLFKRAETLYQLEEQEHDGKHEHGDWVEAYDPHHHSKYYYNHATHEVSWDPPEGWVYTEHDENMQNMMIIVAHNHMMRKQKE